jgi:hypothetical protein
MAREDLMKQRQLTDFPDYVRIRQTVDALRTEQQQVTQRVEEIGVELSKPRQQIGGEDAWTVALEGGGVVPAEIDAKSSLREETQFLEGRLRFIGEALASGELALDRALGKASLEACAEVRAEYVAQVKRILSALREVCGGNEELQRIRREVESRGFKTGALPSAEFDLGLWDDPFGGRLASYRRYVAENFSEVETTRVKRHALETKAMKIDQEEAHENIGS